MGLYAHLASPVEHIGIDHRRADFPPAEPFLATCRYFASSILLPTAPSLSNKKARPESNSPHPSLALGTAMMCDLHPSARAGQSAFGVDAGEMRPILGGREDVPQRL
jgi:hypothetical protein